MTYQKRMTAAVAVSLLIHALALGIGGYKLRFPDTGPAPVPSPTLTVRLEPAERQPARQAVQSLAPAERPPQDTGLISDRDSNAQDPQETVQGKEPAPLDTKANESFEMGGGTAVAAAPAPPPVKKAPDSKKTEKPADKKPMAKPKPVPERTVVAKADLSQAMPAEAAQPEAAAPTPPALPGPLPGARPGKFRGSLEGGIVGKGVLGFEAMKDQLAPYLLEVQRRVERNWNMAMINTYTGTTPTKAIVDCVIGPDGQVLKVEIVKEGNTPSFAPLCKSSIEKSGPFPPFPFKIPDIYRDKTIEIRWTFNFL
ncbi:MAG: TonB C-terminal domain-containing protein [FCB group bacterium]|jgi:hypothetical protein|nr:TonB C-terminal domain-containing protein [FCB group bacterium]